MTSAEGSVPGEFDLSGVLPSESELSAHYVASRVTVRRALEVLRHEGLLESRQGFGWMIAGEPLRQDLHRLGTMEAQLSAAGIRSERRILSFGFVPATPGCGTCWVNAPCWRWRGSTSPTACPSGA